MGGNDLESLKTGFPDKWKGLTLKLAYLYEYFNSIHDYHKPVDNWKKEDFFSKLKKDYPSDEERERTKDIIIVFDNKNGEELTQMYLKSDVLLLTCVFEKVLKVWVNEFGNNPLFCVSLTGYACRCGLKYTGISSQTLQVEDMIWFLENSIRGGISSVFGDRYVKSDESKKILYKDATNLFGHSMSQLLPYDEIELWHDHPDHYMNKLEEIVITPDDSDIEFFCEVDLGCLDVTKEKTMNFPFAPENRTIHRNEYNDYMKKINSLNYTKAKKMICDSSDKKIWLFIGW